MRVRSQDYIGIKFCAITPGSKHYRDIYRAEIAQEHYNEMRAAAVEHLKDTDRQHYFFTESALDIMRSIHVTESFNFKVLRELPARRICLLLSPTRFVRLHVTERAAYVVDIGIDREFSMFCWNLDFGAGLVFDEDERALLWPLVQSATQALVFLFLSPVEVVELPAGAHKSLAQRLTTPTPNETAVALTQVNAHWNQYRVRSEAFAVRGHLRLQACGPRHQDHKLIWVIAHERKGYTRTARPTNPA